ncbi:MAG: translation initiation factor IF-3 [Candidatus Pacebacteria bacterium]|nr:translation initiation factor IF-3 [Candidatus Paceibacterota bacterium]MDP7159592.1 translation initiation factor IF-3 [Candidatus Paceibacterota bacterium]MDP7366311.1 translation initiation factor IF-3 [Candidatus Paceibacterota bacterium]MDP7466200.1 translation initiation factor IF-3 [Candidatus Paceibacterota bacterium]MDP7648500.1 translation initiation factor IF-3 [Candidatus Paceibacterota bacterium]
MIEKVRINKSILAKELRVMGADGANLGVISKDEALRQAETAGLDLIEISPKANPPVAKIMDYGKFQYEQKKKQKEIKAKSHTTETKNIQIKMGTGEHDLSLKSKRISEWLKEGHRVKIDLFLFGRYKYMEFNFLKERLEKFLTLITEEYKVAEAVKKSPKGLTTVIEKTK